MAKVQKGMFEGDRAEVRAVHRLPELTDFYISNGVETGMGDWPPSLARQEFAEECDINGIMERYERTGVITHYSERAPEYLDLTDAPDLMTAMDVMQKAETAFMALPAKVRREFENDAVKFVEFASDASNLDKMREWGLAPPAVVETPSSTAAVPPPAAPPVPVAGSGGAPSS